MKKVRVMIVEDSLVVAELLKSIIGTDPNFEITGTYTTGEKALNSLNKDAPDVISLDIRLPGMNGFDVTRSVMSRRPTPIVVVSANVEEEELNISMNALRAGALAVLDKPPGVTHKDYDAIAKNLKAQLINMSQVKVVRQRLGVRPETSRPSLTRRSLSMSRRALSSAKILGVVASTGGPSALVRLFQGLGEDFPLPILLVQHITPSFLDGFVTWLTNMSPFEVRIAQKGEEPKAGCIYVPPMDRHLEIKEGRLHIDAGPLVSGQRPSGTVLFNSMAENIGTEAMGVLLTGMGDDGATGLLALRKAGGYTVAEDKATAVVFGMPGAAVDLGAACDVDRIENIAGRLTRQLKGNR